MLDFFGYNTEKYCVAIVQIGHFQRGGLSFTAFERLGQHGGCIQFAMIPNTDDQ
jgi:hypothetical protein